MNKNSSKYILVTGAAGYIGSVVAEELIKDGKRIIVLDNLTQGHRESVADEALFVQGDLGDLNLLDELFRDNRIEAVVHLAARTLVGESVTNPAIYFENNLVYGLNLLNIMCKYQVHKIVFSSSCAVYGHARGKTINEDTPKNPINPYGEAKLAFERVLYWYAKSYELSSVSLRYFNAAGASIRCGEDHNPETHLIPNVIKAALGQGKNITVFGSDYPTQDGSCIRDYVHVIDIAHAHILALQKLDKPGLCKAYNLGNGKGYSVLEVIDATKKVTGADIQVVLSERRPGDPPVLVAEAGLARTELGWEPKYTDLAEIIENAYKWMKKHPKGYKTPTPKAGTALHKD
jgi:UDP-glucose 4-epimerase